jgi:outer membrane protein TolC
VNSQNTDGVETELSYRLNVPELGVLIDSAIANNGLLNFRKLEINAKNTNLKDKRNYWTRNFGVQAEGRYGTINNLSSSEGQNASVAISTNVVQVDYYLGAYIKFPVFDVLNRKNEINRAKIEIEQAKFMAKNQRDELVALVITHYENLLLKENLLELRAENYGNAKVNMEMAEKEFRSGLIPVYEYVRISDITANIKALYEQAKTELILAKRLLENLTGLEFN